ncbi:MAG: rhomboid family intramembrane serine protease [Promethearchaeota archaeon]
MVLPTEEKQLRKITKPIFTYTIIIISLAMYFVENISPEIYAFLKNDFGLIPSQLMNGENLHALITSIFLHVGLYDGWPLSLIHIGVYMLLLGLFGDDAENVFGNALFPLFYLFCGVIGGLFHSALVVTFLTPAMDLPAWGSSGAIFGIMAAYAFFFPKRKLKIYYLAREYYTTISYRTVIRSSRISAWVFVVVIILFELAFTLFVINFGTFYVFGNTANIGGFMGGIIFTLLFRTTGRGRWIKRESRVMDFELAEVN